MSKFYTVKRTKKQYVPFSQPKVEEDGEYAHQDILKIAIPQPAIDKAQRDLQRLHPDEKISALTVRHIALRNHQAFERRHPLVSGKLVFDMKATHGLPFDVIFGQIILTRDSRIDWVEFVDTALAEGWLINQIMVSVRAGLEDASIHREYVEEVIQRIKLYITKKFEVKND